MTNAERRFFARPDDLIAYLADRIGASLVRAAWTRRWKSSR